MSLTIKEGIKFKNKDSKELIYWKILVKSVFANETIRLM